MEKNSEKRPGQASSDCLYLKSVIDAMADPVTVVRPDYGVVLVNDRARELFPSAAGEEEGFLCHQLSHHSDEPCSSADHPCPMKEVRETGRPVKVLHEHYDDENRRRFVEITASPLVEDDGSFGGIVESQRDVTDRVLAEKRLKEYAAELESSNRLKDLFIDIMRHDMMNPAFFILTAAGSALKQDVEPRLRDDLQIITRMTRKIVDMIQNASTLAKLEEGKEMARQEVNLAEMMEGAVREHLSAARERGVTIEVKAKPPCSAEVNGLMGDVFSNLVSNAVKYGAEDSTVVASIDEEGDSWRIAVADRGEGVPEGDKDAIFTRFTRRAKEGVKGIGLGLSIVAKVVDAHAGEVWVEDNPGGGSVFVFRLPKRAR